MKDKMNNSRYASYSTFYIEGSTTDYILHASSYSGNAGNSFSSHSQFKFSTKDNNNSGGKNNPAVCWTGAWWYIGGGHNCNLNGRYGDDTFGKGINWAAWKGVSYSLPFVEMKLR